MAFSGLRRGRTLRAVWFGLVALALATVPATVGRAADLYTEDPTPIGHLDGVAAQPDGIRVWGWAIDPDNPWGGAGVLVTIDATRHTISTGVRRPDVYFLPDSPQTYGFDDVLPAAAGRHQVCATALNTYGAGADRPLGCLGVTTGSPLGHLDTVAPGTDTIRLTGWALDPDTAAPIYVWVTIDGTGRHLRASESRADVGRAYPAYGPSHGFGAVLSSAPGRHQVCVTASNVGPGAHTALGCRIVNVTSAASPRGNWEVLSTGVDGSGIHVTGWALDPDTSASIYVWVTVDGVGRHLYADQPRPDVADAFPGYGAAHGFDGTISASASSHRVCVTASNVGPGAHTSLGCRTG